MHPIWITPWPYRRDHGGPFKELTGQIIDHTGPGLLIPRQRLGHGLIPREGVDRPSYLTVGRLTARWPRAPIELVQHVIDGGVCDRRFPG